MYKEIDQKFKTTIPGIPVDPGSSFHMHMDRFFNERCEDIRPTAALLKSLVADIQEHPDLEGF